MKISDMFRFSIDNLRRRKGRTVLTVIGVVVGVCAIVVMVSLGIAVNRATDQMLQGWGDLTKIEVASYGAQQGTPDLDDKMVQQFRELPNVVAATPMYQPRDLWGEVTAGRNNRYTSGYWVIGMDPEAIEPMGYSLVTGNYDISQSLGRDKIPVLVGDQFPFSFTDSKRRPNSPNFQKYPQYDENYMNIINLPQYDEHGTLLNPQDFFFDVMTSKLIYRIQVGYDDTKGEPKYKEYELVPVGMISGGMNDYMVSNGVIMSIENLKKIESDYKKLTKGSGMGGNYGYSYGGGQNGTVQVGGYDSVYVKVNSVDNMPAIEQSIKGTGYQIYSMSEMRNQLQGQVAQTQMMLGGLAAVSLFVAALNIMNTMTMAIYERTKEIGVMKVLGCKLNNIRQIFLIESGAIGLLGGVAGVLLSLLLSALLNYLPMIMGLLGIEGNVDVAGFFGLSGLTDMMPGMKLSVIPTWLIVMAMVFATVVGLLSGIAPANRAVKISSLEAIRHE